MWLFFQASSNLLQIFTTIIFLPKIFGFYVPVTNLANSLQCTQSEETTRLSQKIVKLIHRIKQQSYMLKLFSEPPSSFRIERVKTETVSFIPAFWFQRIRLVIVSETFFTGTTETSIHLAFIRKIGRSVMLKRLKSHSIYSGSFQ